MIVYAGPVTNCLPYGPVGRDGWRCPRCLRYHDANGQPLRGPCDNPECVLISEPGGARHAGPCYASYAKVLR